MNVVSLAPRKYLLTRDKNFLPPTQAPSAIKKLRKLKHVIRLKKVKHAIRLSKPHSPAHRAE